MILAKDPTSRLQRPPQKRLSLLLNISAADAKDQEQPEVVDGLQGERVIAAGNPLVDADRLAVQVGRLRVSATANQHGGQGIHHIGRGVAVHPERTPGRGQRLARCLLGLVQIAGAVQKPGEQVE